MRNFEKLMLLVLVIQATIVCAYAAVGPTPDDYCSATVTLLNQDPYPATPGDYVKLVFQVSGLDTAACNGTNFQLLQSYPFSLDDENGTRSLNGDSYIVNNQPVWMIPYKVRVDKDAVDGDNELWIKYGSYALGTNHYFTQKFNISVENPRTSFEGVIQAITGNELTIAIANTGKNVANSVIVRLPEQKDFTTTGIDGQMVGNLAAGDYTAVSFTVSARQTIPLNYTQRRAESSPIQNNTDIKIPMNISQNKQMLDLLVSYTDIIGERRNVTIELPVSLQRTSQGNTTTTGTSRIGRSTTSSSLIPSWLVAIIIIAIIGAIGLIFHKKRDGIMKFLRGTNKKEKEVPDWMKRERKKSP